MIDCINLNYDWYFKQGFNQEYVLSSYSVNEFEKVDIPHSPFLPLDNFSKNETEKVVCYKREFQLDDKYNGKRIILNFEGVQGFFKVYINGNLVVSDNGSYTSFNFDITNFVEFGVRNFLTVKVDSVKSEEKPVPCDNEDFAVSSGIFREVYLKICDEEYFKNVLVTPTVDENGRWKLKINCKFNTKIKSGKKIFCQIKDPGGNIISSGEKETGYTDEYETEISIDEPELWSCANPNLYTVEIALGFEKEYVKCGLRTAEFKDGKFYLSGAETVLNGLTRKQSYPFASLAMPKSAQQEDAEILKNLGINIVRCTEPPSKHFLKKCDEIGLMVFVEMPGNDALCVNFENRQLTLMKIKDMIYENYNHPSIVLWGVRIKRTDINSAFYYEAIELASSLDESRQTAGNRAFSGSKLFSSDFYIEKRDNKNKKMCIIPEIGLTNIDARSYDGELIRQNQALSYAEDINKALLKKCYCGTMGQSMSDYNCAETYGGGNNIKYSGVLDMFRTAKTAGLFYKSQTEKEPVLELTSSLKTAERYKKGYGKVFILTNCDYVKFYKGEELIGTFYPDRKKYKKIAHPPIELSDFIGNELKEKENFSAKNSETIKKGLLYLAENGGDYIGGKKFKLMPLNKALKKEDISLHELLKLYDKYICNRDCKIYKFEGYIKDKLQITVLKGGDEEKKLIVNCASSELVEDDTYDTCRILVEQKGQTGLSNYSFDIVAVKTNDALKVIGPDIFPLIGGRRAFWVRTNGKSGKGKITVTSEFGTQTLEILVKKN